MEAFLIIFITSTMLIGISAIAYSIKVLREPDYKETQSLAEVKSRNGKPITINSNFR